MVRPRVKMQWIANDSSRKATYYKRKKGIVKKVRELSTLCDVKACLILYRPGNPRPDVWPSVPEAVRVISEMRELPETERRKKMLDQEGLVRQTIKKSTEHLQKQRNEIRDIKKDILLSECLAARSLSLATSIEDVTDIVELAEVRIKQLEGRIEGRSSEVNLHEVVKTSEEVPKVVVDKQEEEAPTEVTMAAAATDNTVQQEVIKTTEEPTKMAVEEKQPSEELRQEQEEQQQQQQQFPQFGVMKSGQQRASGRQILIHPYAGDDTNQWMARAYNTPFFFWNPYNPN